MRFAPILASLLLAACTPAAPAIAPTPAPTATPAAAFPAVDNEGCEHLASGPAVAIDAAPAAAPTAPEVKGDHKRYDIALTTTGGWVKFNSDAASEWVFFLAPDATLKVQDATGTSVALASSAQSSKACADIKGRHSAKLGVGVYFLNLVPATAGRVGMVIKDPNAADDDEK